MDPVPQIPVEWAPPPTGRAARLIRKYPRRTTVACEECRGKKRRCDGVKPVCGYCNASESRRCVWREERNSKGWYRDSYVDALKVRIKELEAAQELAAGTNGLDNSDPSSAASPPQLADSEAQSRLSAQNVDESLQTPGIDRISIRNLILARQSTPMVAPPARFTAEEHSTLVSPGAAFQDGTTHIFESEGSEGGVDAMGIVSSANGIADPHARLPTVYFGPSSNVNLLGEARTAMCRRPCGHGPLVSSGPDPCTICLNEITPLAASEAPSARSGGRTAMFGFSVPPRQKADSLIESYWASVHSLYPFIHQPSFEKRYLTVWNPQNGSESRHPSPSQRPGCYDTVHDRLFYCLLNIVFALGALFNPDINPLDRDRLSRPFFERSKALLDFDLLAQGSLPLVQTLLLMGQYLQSTDMSSSCWNIVGLAIRVAQCIGLHHEPRGYCQGGRQKVDQLETEMRRRAWTGCVFLDRRVLSLAYGRPLMIQLAKSPDQLTLPSAIDDEFLTQLPEAPGSQPWNVPSRIDFYVQAIKLKEILGQVLNTFYCGSDTENKDPAGSEFGSNCTPNYAKEKMIKDSDLQAILNVDGLLTVWHKELPVRLREQTYRDESASPHSPNLEGNEMLMKAANVCVSVAQELVNLITVNFNSDDDLLPAPWYNVFYEIISDNPDMMQAGENLDEVNASGGGPRTSFYLRDDDLPSSNDEVFPLRLFQDCVGLDQAYNPSMNDSSGVNWLSFAPFLDSMEDFGE
ncbi:hypothetical protein G7Z17_g11559 [Cylindrodendrum hubeiense]|uniref:Zn(2)-C6 fungal-type domain-containing protein n=1 Tax=Cylindrodendrum hubeiense TaxID=595255 RepID=A0A9P5L3U9_9HYPO|nr:hypothetical protein G7Z17_g11559 [Cylindrodendrum hubeiense]